MESNMFFGIMLMLELFVLPLLGLYFYKNGKPYLALLLILLVGAHLRFFAASDQYLHNWDERYHAVVAKHLANDPFKPCLYETPIEDYDYKQWANNHVWLHKPPMALWIMAASIKVFGANEFAVRFPSIILSLLSVFLTYLIGSQLYSKKVGLIAAFLLSINGFYLDIGAGRTTTDHVDCAFLFFILLGIYFSIKFYSSKNQWLLLAIGIACGLALLCKWLPGLLIIGLFGIMGMSRLFLPKNAINTGLLAIIAFAFYWPWRVYTSHHFPMEFEWEQHYNLLHLTKALEGHGHPWWYYIDKIRINWNEVIYLVLLFFIWRIFKEKCRNDILLLTWILAPIFIFSFSATKMPGYILISAPAAFIVMAIFCEEIALKWKYKKLGLAVVIAIVLLAQRYCIERVKPFENRKEKAEITMEIKDLGRRVGNTPSVVYGNPYSIETMFYTNLISYATMPTIKGINTARQKGRQVVVLYSDNLPEFILTDSLIVVVKSPLNAPAGN